MLEEAGRWLDINGQAVYGSRAWTRLGEGEMVNGKLKTLPGGGLGKRHADFQFTPHDIRFTVGKDGALYAFTMSVPEGGQTVSIKSLGKPSGSLAKVKQVALLGYNGKMKWKQTREALEIIYPADARAETSAVFRIVMK